MPVTDFYLASTDDDRYVYYGGYPVAWRWGPVSHAVYPLHCWAEYGSEFAARRVFLRFPIDLPMGATVNDVQLYVVARETSYNLTTMAADLRGASEHICPAFDASEDEVVSGLVLGGNAWAAVYTAPQWMAGSTYQFSGSVLAEALTAFLATPDYAPGDYFGLALTPNPPQYGQTDWRVYSYEDADDAPYLRVNWTAPQVYVPAGLSYGVKGDAITGASADDRGANLSANTWEAIDATSIRFGLDSGVQRAMFLRFPISEPAGGEVGACYLRLTAAASESQVCNVRVYLCNYDNCPEFTDGNFATPSAVSLTSTYVSWSVQEWTTGQRDTVNIQSLVRTFIHRSGYTPGNYMGLCIKLEG